MSSYFSTPNYNKENGKLAGLADSLVNGSKELLVSKSWGPLVVLARWVMLGQLVGFFHSLTCSPCSTTVISLMEKLERGQLRVISVSTGEIYTFGTPAIYDAQHPNPNKLAKPNKATDEIRAEIRVVNDAFWVRMLLLSDLGFSEAFMTGDIEVDDLDALFKVSLGVL